jgi:hypothetical protein
MRSGRSDRSQPMLVDQWGFAEAPTTDEVGWMATYEAGSLLTCGHDGCGCRVRVEVECHCSGAVEAYRCTCGHELVPAE